MISKEEVQNLAQLARLELSDIEVSSLQKDISNILEYIGQVSAVSAEAENAPLPAGRQITRNVLRADEPYKEGDSLSNKREAILSQLPKREGDYNVVRKIISKDE